MLRGRPPADGAARPAPRDVRARRASPCSSAARRRHARRTRSTTRDAWRVAAAVGDRPARPPARATPRCRSTTTLIAGPARAHPRRRRPARRRGVRRAGRGRAAPGTPGEQAAAAGPLAEADRLRTALLSAVSHDLRTPLASAKAAVDSLRSPDVEFSDRRPRRAARHRRRVAGPAQPAGGEPARHEPAAGRRARRCRPQLISVAEVVPRALDDLGARPPTPCTVHVPDDLPEVYADPGLLERVLANLSPTPLRYSPPASRPSSPPASTADRSRSASSTTARASPPPTGTGLPALPAPRRPRQQHRRRPRPGPVPRPGRGHGRHPRPPRTHPAAA